MNCWYGFSRSGRTGIFSLSLVSIKGVETGLQLDTWNFLMYSGDRLSHFRVRWWKAQGMKWGRAAQRPQIARMDRSPGVV